MPVRHSSRYGRAKRRLQYTCMRFAFNAGSRWTLSLAAGVNAELVFRSEGKAPSGATASTQPDAARSNWRPSTKGL